MSEYEIIGLNIRNYIFEKVSHVFFTKTNKPYIYYNI